jgi:transcriptional regulator with GAF, ATPase, and Fis domain
MGGGGAGGSGGGAAGSASGGGAAGDGATDDIGLNLRASLKVEEKRLLEEALRQAAGVRREAARLLGIDERNLSYYMRKHEL